MGGGGVIVLHQGQDALLVGLVVEHAHHVHAGSALGDGVGGGDHAGAPLLLQQLQGPGGHGGGAEVVQGDDEGDVAAGARHARVADHGVNAVGVAVVQLPQGGLPALGGGQVGGDVPVLQVDVDGLVALLLQLGHDLGPNAAGAAGYHVNTHVQRLTLSYFSGWEGRKGSDIKILPAVLDLSISVSLKKSTDIQ